MKYVTIDVRENLQRGEEPFGRIMNAAQGLELDEGLRVLAPFEPVPLYSVLERIGFGSCARQLGPNLWEVCFERYDAVNLPEDKWRTEKKFRNGLDFESGNGCASESGRKEEISLMKVDARGLVPPEPMMLILETLDHLPARCGLLAFTDRRPIHLYPHLEDRGYLATTKQGEDGGYVTRIEPLT